jgi:flavin-binding protein dodecin
MADPSFANGVTSIGTRPARNPNVSTQRVRHLSHWVSAIQPNGRRGLVTAQVGGDVPGGVVKVIELVGSSERSFSDAVRNAVRVASRTIRNIQGVEVISSNADVNASGELTLYKVNCKLAFLVESGERAGSAGS